MTTEIFMTSGDGTVQVVVQPGEYVIGREDGVDILIDDPSVSAQHARLVVESETVCIQDLDSENGTFVDGDPAVGLTSLYDGQTAVLGSIRLRVRQSVDPEHLGSGPRYVRGGMVAYGGMGAIHEARQAAMGRKVAMKVMLHSWHAASVKRFLDEARITGMLEHPNIVPVHELGIDEEDQIFYTMKFVRGSTLAEVLAALGSGNADSVKKFPIAALLTVFQKVCDAVAFAHSRGIWHRDLKPENIMIGDFGEVLVMDWGLAKESGLSVAEPQADPSAADLDGGEASLRTMQGAVLGTPAYMSPEQARGETSEIDQRSDVYALGAVLHEILYLQPAVSGKNRDEVVEKVAAGVRDKPAEKPLLHLPGHRVPASLEAVSRKAMAFERGKRYQQVTDLQADITAYQSGFATSAESAGLGKHLLLFVKRNRGVSVAVAAGLAALFFSSVLFTVNLVRARDRAKSAQLVAESNEKKAQEALDKALDMEGQARSSDRKAEAALGEKEAIRERYLGIYGSAEKAAEESARRSRRLLAEGKFADAMVYAGNAAQLMPESTEYLIAKANLLQSGGRLKEAAETYRRVLASGENEQARANLELTEQLIALQGKKKKPTTECVLLLEKQLMQQGRELELVLLHAAADGQRLEQDSAGDAREGKREDSRRSLEAKLAGFTRQAGWRKDRLSRRADGSWDVDLSGLAVSDLSVLRGENIHSLNLRNTATELLNGIRGLRLVSLDLGGTKVEDLTPIRPMLLEKLVLDGTRVRNLDPIRGMPLRQLRADCSEVTDFSPLSTLLDLEELALPLGAGAVDTRALPKLRTVEHPRYRENGALSADEFRKISSEFEKLRAQWTRPLEACGAEKVPPERVKVRESPLVDIDLRGFKLKDLAPLKDVPLRALWLGSGQPLDISGLAGHPTLRHLNLSSADVREIAPVLGNKQLETIILSKSTTDAAKAAGSQHLKKLGYAAEESDIEPRLTLAEFFSPRAPGSDDLRDGSRPVVAWRFDEPAKGADGWTLSGAAPGSAQPAWQADPVREQGRGGGCILVVNEPGASEDPYLAAPPEMLVALRQSHGGVLEFDLRASPINRYLSGSDVVLEGAGMRLHFFSQVRPDGEWQSFLVPLRQHPAWRKGSRDGPIASASDLRTVLQQPTALKIRTQHAEDGPGHRVVAFDDVAIWSDSSAAQAQARRDRQQLSSIAWGRGLEVASLETLERAEQQGLRGFREGDGVWVAGFEGRRGVLTVHPFSPDKAAVVTFRSGVDVPEGSKLEISGRGSYEEPGVRVIVRQKGRQLGSFAMNRPWQKHTVELSSSSAADAAYEIEVASDVYNMEDAYFDEISLLLPDGKKKFARLMPTGRAPAPFPAKVEDLDGPWIWDAQGFRAGICLRNGKLPRHNWTFQLAGRRLLVRIGEERAVELRQSENGNWYGVQYPERVRILMERVEMNRSGQLGHPRTLSDINGNWVWDYGAGKLPMAFRRGKPQGLQSAWKLRLENGILNVEVEPGKVTDLVPQDDGSWLGFEPLTEFIINFYPDD